MDRRNWLKYIGGMAALGIAGKELEILEKVGWKRTMFPAAEIYKHKSYVYGFQVTAKMLEDNKYAAILQEWLNEDRILDSISKSLKDMLYADAVYGPGHKKSELKFPFEVIDIP